MENPQAMRKHTEYRVITFLLNKDPIASLFKLFKGAQPMIGEQPLPIVLSVAWSDSSHALQPSYRMEPSSRGKFAPYHIPSPIDADCDVDEVTFVLL